MPPIFQKVESGIDAVFGGEKHSHAHVGHVCDQLHLEHISNRFHSFAPESSGNIKWFVDGCSYFWAVSEALEHAKKSIYILGWWLSPELYLRRPPSKNAQYRLDTMLKAAAERGVTINIIVYKEVQAALTLDSAHTKHALEALHPNIHVFRHPDHIPTGYDIKSEFKKAFSNLTHFDLAQATHDAIRAIYGVADDIVLYWAHHEKLLIVDSELAFMGGLDLCFGRWDTNSHPIADAHPGDLEAIIFPGQDYNNARVFDFSNVGDLKQNKLDRTKSSRMGWSDVTVNITGPIVESLTSHFIDRWNYIFYAKYNKQQQTKYSSIQGPGTPLTPIKVGKAFNDYVDSISKRLKKLNRLGSSDKNVKTKEPRIQLTRSCTRWSSGHRTEHSVANAYAYAITSAQHFIYIENQFFITATSGKQHPVANKIGAAIVNRILRAHEQNQPFKIWVVMPAVPAFAGDLKSNDALGTRAIMKYQYNSICRGGHSILEKLQQAGIKDPNTYISFYNLRNFDRINTSKTMDSAEKAAGVKYEDARKEHDDEVGAGMHPEGEGTAGASERYKSYQKEASKVDDTTKDTVSPCYMDGREGLTDFTWNGDPDREMDAFVSEELYIHSKLLIADDRLVICGSANLNDRSQLGSHDSEIAVVIEDGPMISTKFNGKSHQVSKFASSLRRQIFRKHLGLLPDQRWDEPTADWHPLSRNDVSTPGSSRGSSTGGDGNEYDWGSPGDILVRDPLHQNFTNLWESTAKANTEVFRRGFHAVPDDSVRTWADYDEFFSKHFRIPKASKGDKEDGNSAKKDKARRDEKQDENNDNKNKDGTGDDNVKKADRESGNDQDEDCKKEKKKSDEKVDYGHVVRSEFPGGVAELKNWLGRVRGALVEMPLNFLADVDDIAKMGLALNSLTEEIYT